MSNVRTGGIVYIRAKDCKLVKRPFANDQSYGFLMLQPGTPVIWLGEATENKAFHKIQYQGQLAYTLFQNLSTKPFAEFTLAECYRCKGTGSVSINWGNSNGFISCPSCKGTGGSLPTQAYPSFGVGIKG